MSLVCPEEPGRCIPQVPGRHKADTGDSEGFALYCFTRRLCHARREVINSQVVVVGASECGISAIEQLLCSTELEFTSITLVAPGGITVGGAGSSYSSQDVSRIGLDAQVRGSLPAPRVHAARPALQLCTRIRGHRLIPRCFRSGRCSGWGDGRP